MVTLAAGTTAPEVSLTTPTTSAVVMVWLKAGGVVIRNTGVRNSTAKRVMRKRFMERTPLDVRMSGTSECLELRHGPANRASRDCRFGLARSKGIQQAAAIVTNRFDPRI